MIEGIEKAGKNPTHAAVITALRGIKDYTGGGILPYHIDYSTIFGHDLPKECAWYMEAEPKGFVATSPQPLCGRIFLVRRRHRELPPVDGAIRWA